MAPAPQLSSSYSQDSVSTSASGSSVPSYQNGSGTGLTSPASFSGQDSDLDVIPPYHPSRTLVLCFDGTGDQFDADNSNVVLLFSMLMKHNPDEQMVYYQAGIGTYTIPQIATPLWADISETMDMMIAWNMDAHVMGGYEFLMSNYRAGDKICLFGFSRGAYTARALAGMVHKVGLLPRSNHQQVPFAYKMFTRTDEIGWKQSNAFKKTFSMDVEIDFIGVWDTVCSVGLIPHTLPFTASNSAIRVFRHALSLDEHRAKFKANHYNWPTDEEAQLGIKPGEMHKAGKIGRKQKSLVELEEEFEDAHNGQTDVLEVWFAGCHCDVGGGSVSNESTHNLARIPLRWMIRQCFLTNAGVRFHGELLKKIGLDPASLYPVVKTRPPALYSQPLVDHKRDNSTDTLVGSGAGPANEEEDLVDALCPIYDQLKLAPYWWILEVLPLEHRRQTADHQWVNALTVNMGHGRIVPAHEPFYVHRSVDIRLKGQKYKPNAVFSQDPVWVD